jgi:hypothetical protein
MNERVITGNVLHTRKPSEEIPKNNKIVRKNGINTIQATATEGDKVNVEVIPKQGINGLDYKLKFTIPRGKDGVSIKNTYVNRKYHLIVIMSDGTEYDVGRLKDSIVRISRKPCNAIVEKEDGIYVKRYDDRELKIKIESNSKEIERLDSQKADVEYVDDLFNSITVEQENIEFHKLLNIVVNNDENNSEINNDDIEQTPDEE